MATRSPPRAGTGYIGLDQWLAVNQPQAAAMADAVSADVNAKGKKADKSLEDAKELFNYGVDGQAINYDPEQYANPSRLLDLEKTAADAEKQVAGAWGGPNGIEDIAGFGKGMETARDAQRSANLAGDTYGRTALFQDKYGKTGGYTFGQQLLDSALAGAAGGDKFDAVKSQWGGLLGKYDAASAAAKSRVEGVKAGNAAAAKQYRADADAARAKYNAELEKQAMAGQGEVDRQRANGRQQQEEAAAANRDAINSGRIPTDRKGKTAVDDWMDPGTLPGKRYKTNPNRGYYGGLQG